MSEPLCPKCNYGRMVALFMSGPVCSHDCDRNPVPKREPSTALQNTLDAPLSDPFKVLRTAVKTSRSFNVGQYVLVSSLPGISGKVIAIDHRKNLVRVSFVKPPSGWFDPKELI